MCVCVCVCVHARVHVHTHIHHIFFIHSSVDGHLGCFHVLAIVNSAATNTGVCIYLFELEFSPDICPGVVLLDRLATLFLAF